MSELADLVRRPTAEPHRTVAVTGKVAVSPATPDDELYVTVESFDGSRQQWGPCPWVPGSALPARGTEVLVVFDEAETPWVITQLGGAGGGGEQGPPGPAGTPGEVWYTGSGAPAGTIGIVGDWYLDSANGDFYEKTGDTAWTKRGNLKGPVGPQGPAGATGAQGPPGTQGPQGPAGPTGPEGPEGDTGPAGATGAQGPTGPPGPEGDPGVMEVYEQPAQPASTQAGAIWIDTDDVPPAWASLVPLVSVLPSNPVDAQEVYYLADAAQGIVWHLRYRAASPSAYKWELVGGSALAHEVAAPQGTPSTSYTDLATVGPYVTVPLAGEYSIRAGAGCFGSVAGIWVTATVKLGAAAAADSERVVDTYIAVAGVAVGGFGRSIVRAAAAGSQLKLQYRTYASGTASFVDRYINAVPVRVG